MNSLSAISYLSMCVMIFWFINAGGTFFYCLGCVANYFLWLIEKSKSVIQMLSREVGKDR